MTQRVVSGSSTADDPGLDTSLRPLSLDQFVGQARVKDNLDITMRAARLRDEPLDHTIIYGPPGLGKTTLAFIIAHEMGVNIKVTSGPAIERAGDMAAILTSLSTSDLLFIDEVHRLSRVVEEILYSAMEDFFLSWVVGKGLGARNINLRINPFTLVGATTRFSMVSPPLRDRFGAVYHLDYYDEAAMRQIVERSARILQVDIDEPSISHIAARSRGTPRVANRLIKRCRDYAQVMGDGKLSEDMALHALERLEVDPLGLDETDHRLLESIMDKFGGGPVGLDTLAASISEESDTIMDVYEPFLLQLGFLERTPRGRVATLLAYRHLNRTPKGMPSQQAALPLDDATYEGGSDDDL